jgi:transcriptional regulator with GAF, ATPase, and Fis domain
MNINPFDPDLQALQVHLKTLPKVIERKVILSSLFRSIHEKMNQGLFYEDILDFVFMSLDKIIPYDRIGIALIEEEGKQIRLSWVRSKLKISTLKKDYSASMKNSSLQKLLSSGQPRIINNLEAYLIQNPDSISTKLALEDGINSSLTCPLIFDGRPLGVIFFSSAKISTYDESHIDLFSEIASGLALIVEQGLHKKTRELLNS